MSQWLVKIIHSPSGPFLNEVSFDDLAKQSFGIISKRPMVYMVNVHEALEKSLWCYEQGMVPVIAEPSLELARFVGTKYRIDQLIVDQESLQKLEPYLHEFNELETVVLIKGDTSTVTHRVASKIEEPQTQPELPHTIPLERKDVVAYTDKILADFISSPPKDSLRAAVRITSGTTSSPIMTIDEKTADDKRGISNSQRTLYCLGSRSVRLSVLALARANKSPLRLLSLDVKDLSPKLKPLLEEFAPDTVHGFSSFVIKMCETGADLSHVQTLRVGGEMLTPELEVILKKYFPHARITSNYIASELGVISKPLCEFQKPNHFHPAANVSIDIYEPDSDGVGDILVTKRVFRDIVFEKYRVGDMGKLLVGPCLCGEAVTFQVLGRSGSDYLKLAGALLRQEEFDRVCQKLGLYDDYRARASLATHEGVLKGALELEIFSSKGVGTPALAKEIAQRFARALFVTPSQTLAQLIEQGFFMPVTVVWRDAPFPPTNKLVKLSRS